MKILFFLFLFSSIRFANAQYIPKHYSGDSALVLVADNGKHYRLYGKLRTLKIRYYHHGAIIKAKGKLLVRDKHHIRLIPFNNKAIAVIPVDSIFSIMPWHRTGKIIVAIIAGTGLAEYGLASGKSGSYLPFGFVFLGAAVISLGYVAIALPAALLGEWLFVRSTKKGYHFSVEKIALQSDF